MRDLYCGETVVLPVGAHIFETNMAAYATTKRGADSPVIPDRLYFKIGDVAQICGVETYVLRFWETQFPQLKPNKSGTGQRLYRKREVELALDIKRLVHAEGYTIAGARQALDSGNRRGTRQPSLAAVPAAVATAAVGLRSETQRAAISRVKSELREIAEMLTAAPAAARRERPRVLRGRTESERLFPL
jgi:DNA-binding transcriptional MerR regulator